jgi:outer membrane receptor protein involved in Fe transport
MSGSRLNSSLKDTAAAVMVFTPEFLSDFGATSLADIIGYAPNMQVDMLDASADASTSFLGGSDLRDTRIRVRGLSASTAVDFFETGIAVDTYNTERLELSGGPNSILFGFGSPGGLVNIMTKRAQVGGTAPRSGPKLAHGLTGASSSTTTRLSFPEKSPCDSMACSRIPAAGGAGITTTAAGARCRSA